MITLITVIVSIMLGLVLFCVIMALSAFILKYCFHLLIYLFSVMIVISDYYIDFIKKSCNLKNDAQCAVLALLGIGIGFVLIKIIQAIADWLL